MARKEETGEFRLDVPLDASGIEDFKPEQPVKVLALAGDRPLASQTVKLDAKGHGTARLTLSERPGALRVIVGPARCVRRRAGRPADHQRQRLRPAMAGQERAAADAGPHPSLLLALVVHLVPHLHHPRRRALPGRLAGPGRQGVRLRRRLDLVVGQQADHQVRHHRRQRRLRDQVPVVLRLVAVVVVAAALLAVRAAAGATHQPDPAARPAPRRPGRGQPAAVARRLRLGPLGRRRADGSGEHAVDPAALSGLRDKLLKRLPTAVELERLHLWPWWPWYPWWDCTPDVIFKVTQECAGKHGHHRR